MNGSSIIQLRPASSAVTPAVSAVVEGSAATGDSVPPGCTPNSSGKSSTKTKKIMYDVSENDDFDREEIATYEEVARLFPRPGVFRPVVLIGPPGVGRNELKRRLMALDPDRYKATVPRKYRQSIQRPRYYSSSSLFYFL